MATGKNNKKEKKLNVECLWALFAIKKNGRGRIELVAQGCQDFLSFSNVAKLESLYVGQDFKASHLVSLDIVHG